MYDRSGVDVQSPCPSSVASTPWRNTQIPVELFDLITAPPHTRLQMYRLHYEILQFYHFMVPNEEENAVREQVIDRVRMVIQRYLPSATVEVYGSHKTKLNLPKSDVDLIVYSVNRHQWSPAELVEIMTVLRNAFCVHQICTPEDIQILNYATIPIIKLIDRRTDVRVDMSFNMNGGPQSTQLILDYMEEYPYLKYLFYVLKQYLTQLDLNAVWTGGISSYSLILMLVCFFQKYYKKDSHQFASSSSSSSSVLVNPPPSSSSTMKNILSTSIKPNNNSINGTIDDGSSSVSYPSSSAASCVSSDDHINCSNHSSDNDDDHLTSNRNYPSSDVFHDHVNLGDMLISFLELYGILFDYAKLGIRVQRPDQPNSKAGFIDKDELFKNFCCDHRTTTNLCIVDPFNDKNDIGNASWLIPKLKLVFRDAFEILTQSTSPQKSGSKKSPSILSQILTVNEEVLKYREQLHQIYLYSQNEQLIKRIHFGPAFYNLSDLSFMNYANGIPISHLPHIAYPSPFIQPLPPPQIDRSK